MGIRRNFFMGNNFKFGKLELSFYGRFQTAKLQRKNENTKFLMQKFSII